jgi:hypothetical protein
MRRGQQIGFAQRVKLAWLEQVASLALTGKPTDEVWEELTAYLVGEISTGSAAKRGSREKVRTVLTQVWLDGPRQLREMRNDGLLLLRSLPPKDHLAVHWGMTMAVYPFCSTVAATIGKLASLQGDIQTTQIQRRMQEQFGERETVRVNASKLLELIGEGESARERQTMANLRSGRAQGLVRERRGQIARCKRRANLLGEASDFGGGSK